MITVSRNRRAAGDVYLNPFAARTVLPRYRRYYDER
jgi:hypothetical protein